MLVPVAIAWFAMPFGLMSCVAMRHAADRTLMLPALALLAAVPPLVAWRRGPGLVAVSLALATIATFVGSRPNPGLPSSISTIVVGLLLLAYAVRRWMAKT